MDRRVPARMALSQPPYWVWKEGTDFETGVGWIRRLGAHAHSHVARGCAALGQAEVTLEYLEHMAPGRITAEQACMVREACSQAEALRNALDDLYRSIDATATLT